MSALRAVLVDMDGTLADSESAWESAESALAARFGRVWSPGDARSYFGRPLSETAQAIIDRGVRMSVPEAIDWMVDHVAGQHTHGVPWLPGARELLTELAACEIPCALVTMSPRRLALAVAEDAPSGAIGWVVSGDDVERGKPHPEAYLQAARLIGVDPAQCVSIEDSVSGVASATAAGTTVLAVPSRADDRATMRGTGCGFAGSLAEVDVALLERIHGHAGGPGVTRCRGLSG